MTFKVLSSQLGNHNGHQLSATSFPELQALFLPCRSPSRRSSPCPWDHTNIKVFKVCSPCLLALSSTYSPHCTDTHKHKQICLWVSQTQESFLSRTVAYIIQVLPNRSSIQLLMLNERVGVGSNLAFIPENFLKCHPSSDQHFLLEDSKKVF